VLQNAKRQVALAAQALASAKDRQKDLEDDVADAVEALQRAEKQQEREAAELKDRLRGLRKNNVDDRAAVISMEDTLVKNKKQLALLEDQHAHQNHQLDIQRQALRDQLAEVEPAWLQAVEARSAADADRKRSARTVTEMESAPTSCPTCGKPWDKGHSEEEIRKAREAFDQAEARLNKAASAASAQGRKREEIKSAIARLETQMSDFGHLKDTRYLNDQITRMDRLMRSLNATIHERELQIAAMEKGPDTSLVAGKAAVVEERKRNLAAGEGAIHAAAADLAEEESLFRVVEYWQKAFGPTGISNMLLADAIGPLNRVAQRISGLMTGGSLRVSYSTRRELATGDSKAQLVIRVDNRIGSSKRPEGSSKGESGLTNLIIAENLSEVGQVSKRVGFRWYDEVTSGQDAVVRRAIFAYLKDVAQRLGILIFVVDHHIEASAYCDYVLLAEKTIDHGTRYSWK
jgi:DNA repair exonuclease SbcCD ATPase subunit